MARCSALRSRLSGAGERLRLEGAARGPLAAASGRGAVRAGAGAGGGMPCQPPARSLSQLPTERSLTARSPIPPPRRYLAESGCTAMCVNLCKAPCQSFFTEQLGMPLVRPALLHGSRGCRACWRASHPPTHPPPSSHPTPSPPPRLPCSPPTADDGPKLRGLLVRDDLWQAAAAPGRRPRVAAAVPGGGVCHRGARRRPLPQAGLRAQDDCGACESCESSATCLLPGCRACKNRLAASCGGAHRAGACESACCWLQFPVFSRSSRPASAEHCMSMHARSNRGG